MTLLQKYIINSFSGWLITLLIMQYAATCQIIVPSNNMDDFVVKNYDKTDGLSHNLTTYMFSDSRGMVWIGSDEGLNVFDGSRFKNLFLGKNPGDISGDRVVYITEDSSGIIWLVSTSIDAYNPLTKQVRNYPFKSAAPGEGTGIRCVFIKAGEPVWVFTNKGLYFLEPKTGVYSPYHKVMPKNKTFSSTLFYDGYVYDKVKNQLWMGTYSGVGCYDFNSRTLFNSENNPDNLPIYDCKPAWSSFKKTPGGNIFFVDAKSDSLVSYQPESKHLKKYALPAVNEKILDYFALHTPPDGSIWMGLRNGGLFLLDTLSRKYIQLSNSDKYKSYIKDNYIWQISNDYQGNIWVCHGEGAAVIAKQPYQYKTIFGPKVIKELIRLSRLNHVHKDSAGKIWAAANRAHLVMYDPITEKQHEIKIPGADSVGIYGVLPFTNEKLILSGNNGLWEFTKSTNKFRKIKLTSNDKPFNFQNFRRKPLLLPDGRMAFPEAKGIVLFNPKNEKATFFPYLFFHKKDSSLYVPGCIAHNGKGGLFVSFLSEKMSLFDWNPSTNEVIALHEKMDTEVRNKIKPLGSSFLAPDGSLFMSDRIFGFWKIGKDFKTVRHFTRNDGLLSNIVIGFAAASNGDIWIQTYSGISCLRATSGIIESFDPGYPEMKNFYYGFHLDTLQKKIYISDENNIRIIDYPAFKANVPDFIIGISEVRINGISRIPINGNLPDLQFNENNIIIDVATFNYFPNVQTNISYILSNNPIPVKMNGGRQINLTGMESGSYTLTIEAEGQFGKKSKPLQLFFRILPAWYDTWWFRGICFVLSVAFIWYIAKLAQKEKLKKLEQQNEIFRLKTERLTAIARERERITADLHDDVGATLSSLNIYGDLAHSIWDENPEKSKEMVGKIAGQSRELMFRMSDIIWSMKAEGNGTSGITPRIKNFAQELLSGKGIVVDFKIDETTMSAISNPMVRKNIILIIKEALNNIAKYSHAKKATILLEKRDEMLFVEIADDGNGFDMNLEIKGNGLENIDKRCRQMGGIFNLQSKPGGGTTLTCSMPLAIISYNGNE